MGRPRLTTDRLSVLPVAWLTCQRGPRSVTRRHPSPGGHTVSPPGGPAGRCPSVSPELKRSAANFTLPVHPAITFLSSFLPIVWRSSVPRREKRRPVGEACGSQGSESAGSARDARRSPRCRDFHVSLTPRVAFSSLNCFDCWHGARTAHRATPLPVAPSGLGSLDCRVSCCILSPHRPAVHTAPP